MFSKPWQNWLTVLLAIIVVGAMASYFLAQQHLMAAANYCLWSSQVLAIGWTVWGQWKKRDVRWIKWSGVLLLGTVFIFAVSGFYFGWVQFGIASAPTDPAATQPNFSTIVVCTLLPRETFALPRIWALGLTGVWLMGIAFFGGMWLMRQMLVGSHPMIGVARTLVDEAIRMKIVFVLVVLVVLMIAWLPLLLNPTERLEYRVQTFISLSTHAVWIMLSIMTIVIACTSICYEISEKQIYLTMTKAIGKMEYLLGKWLGICLINLWLITVAFGGIYMSAKILSVQRPRDQADFDAVRDHILAARSSIYASPPDPAELTKLAIDHYIELRQSEPDKYATTDVDTGNPIEVNRAYSQLAPKLRDGIQNFAVSKWQSIKPRDASVFWFRGAGKAKEFAHDNVQLKLKPRASPVPPDEQIRMALKVNGVFYPKPIVIVQNTVFTVDIPVNLADRNGDFELLMYNINPADPENTFQTTISFPPGTGMEMVYPVGTFEGNLLRAMVMIYSQLVFLGMLALAAGTFLGFPVACLFCGMVLIVAISAGFLAESLDSYAAVPVAELSLWQRGVTLVKGISDKLITGQFWEACRVFIRLFGEAALIVNPNLAAHSPIDQLIDGKVITNNQVVQCVLRVGVCGTLICGLFGWAIWRKREIARVIV